MKILSIDSSSVCASAAVAADGKVLAEVFVNNGFTHSVTLMNVIRQALTLSGVPLTDIDRIACVTGPGSFTGVRIGVACAKGLAFPGEIPCISVSTLETFPYNLSCVEGYVCGVMDARCRQVYTALFRVSGGVVTRCTADEAVAIDTLTASLEKLDGDIYLLGDGAHLVKAQMPQDRVKLVNANNRYQRASSAALAAMQKAEDVLDAAQLVPCYLRLPQAERELNNKRKNQT